MLRMVNKRRFPNLIYITPLLAPVFTFVVMIVLIAFAVITTQVNRQDMLSAEMHNLDSLSETLAQQTQRIVFSSDLMVAALQERIESAGIKTSEELYRFVATQSMHEIMKDMVIHATDIEALNFADASGRLVSSRTWPPNKVNVADRKYFIALSQGAKSYISEPIKSRLTGQEIIILGHRMDTQGGTFLGIVFTAISTHRFKKLFADVAKGGGQSTRLFLFRRDGQLIAAQSTTANNILEEQAVWKSVANEVERTDKIDFYQTYDKDSMLLALQNVLGYPLSIVLIRSEEEVLAQWRSLSLLIYVFTAGLMVMALFAARVFQRLTKTRLQLTVFAHQQAQANAELEIINRRLTETQHFAQMGQWEIDLLTHEVVWSDEVYAILELVKAETTASYDLFLSYVHPDDRAALENAYQMSITRKEIYQLTHRLLMLDGRIKYIIGRGRTDYDNTGNPVYSTGSIQDISALRMAEDKLRDSHEKYQRLVDDIGDQFVIFSLRPEDAQFTYASSGVGRIFGIPRDAVLGRIWRNLVDWSPGSIDTASCIVAELQSAAGSSRHFEASFRHHDGNERTISVAIHPVKDASDDLIAIEGIIENITKRKQAEEDLRVTRNAAESSRHMLQLVLDNIPVRVFWKDRELKYMGCNKLFAYDAGFQEPNELLGHNDFDMAWKNEAKQYQADDFRVMETDAPQLGYEEPQTTSEGQRIWLRTSKIPLKDDGKVFGILGTYEDITQRKQVEDDLRIARNAAESANHAKSAFLANMSHEIRTPMNAILGFTHMLLRNQPSPEQSDKLKNIASAGGHLMAILNDVLDLSKIEAGRMTLSPITFQPAVLLENLRVMFADRLAVKGIEMRVETTDLPAALIGDEVRLSQALINFLGNATKFTDHGYVTLRARALTESEDDVLMIFEVQDTGIGIAEDKLGAVFNAFEQADNSMTRKYGGTGLGLAITRSLASLMGGDVGVKSVPGEGSSFWLTAQLGKVVCETVALPEVKNVGEMVLGDCSGWRVLLAEDEPLNQQLAVDILSEFMGLQVDVADNGAIALEMASKSGYDVILMDMQMPTMNGLEATQKIRQLPSYKRTPILAMTGNAFAEDRRRCFDAGMDDFIAKPFTPDQLIETLRRWLKQLAA